MGPYYTLCILLLNYLRNVDIFLIFLCPYCTILGFSLPHSPFFLVEASGLHKKYTLISLLPNFVKKRRNFLNLIRNKITKYKRLSLELYFFNIKNIFILTIHFSWIFYLFHIWVSSVPPLLMSREMSPHSDRIFFWLVFLQWGQLRWVEFFFLLHKLFKLSTDFSHTETTGLSFS